LPAAYIEVVASPEFAAGAPGHLAVGAAAVGVLGVGLPLRVAGLELGVADGLSVDVAAHQPELGVVVSAVAAAGHMSVQWDCRCPELSSTLSTM